MINTEVLLTECVFGTPSGYYDGSSLDFFSATVRAAGYYRGYGSTQTLYFSGLNFIGQVRFWATLDDLQDTADWFLLENDPSGASVGGVYTPDPILIGDGVNPVTGLIPITVVGNFVWIRAEIIGFSAGTIFGININF